MTAQELIIHLKTLPPETKVVVRGYEDGYNDILKIRTVKIKHNENSRWYDGEYDNSEDSDAINALDLFGENKNPKDDL
ncbi:MAG: hypothetical protein WCF65_09440 [Parachlamydiaceae bacterium]|jgi:hypothetical protein